MIVSAIWGYIVSLAIAFWPWIVGVATAILAFLFSPTIRKYTVAALAFAMLLGLAALWGYNSNHHVTTVTHQCSEFSRYLTKGAATDKALGIFKRHGLCL